VAKKIVCKLHLLISTRVHIKAAIGWHPSAWQPTHNISDCVSLSRVLERPAAASLLFAGDPHIVCEGRWTTTRCTQHLRGQRCCLDVLQSRMAIGSAMRGAAVLLGLILLASQPNGTAAWSQEALALYDLVEEVRAYAYLWHARVLFNAPSAAF
jgi:hypothetical protein